ncbi:MAG TPA: 2Fe-2S iron-sulfur cluster-binding protein, partial [Thermoplasmataceae archaeon]|nr:2Fe-2S iron-sulfur cluster-binding protein [Thermoplasmataceae archaeon]
MISSQRKKRKEVSVQKIDLEFELNGVPVEADVEPRSLLAFFLRDHLGVKGIHVGCDTTNCGACTVLMDG